MRAELVYQLKTSLEEHALPKKDRQSMCCDGCSGAAYYWSIHGTGSWVKCRVNRGQELVIGGYIPGPHGFDSLIVGYYRGKNLVYVARVRNGFVPASRRQVFEKIRSLVSPTMPFVNLPDTHKSRWGDELTAEKMKECVWLRPEAVAQIEFLEWTEAETSASDYTRSSSTT